MSDLINKENGLGMLCKTCGQNMSVCEYGEDDTYLIVMFACKTCSEGSYMLIDKATGDGEIMVGPIEKYEE